MPLGGMMLDRYGRKWGIAVITLITIIGATIQGAAAHEAIFFINRFIFGISVTLGSVAGPA